MDPQPPASPPPILLRDVPAVLLTLLCTAAALFSGPLAVVTALLLVYLWRRLVRRPWSGVGMRWSRWSLPQFLLGVGAAVGAPLAANAVAVALGAAVWVPWEPDGLAFLPLVIAMIVVGQVFPEELLWRGNFHDILSDRLSRGAVIAVTSLVFGALHVFSQSEAEGAVERALFALTAVTLGFACAASRARTGTLWMAVGVHSGFYFGTGFFPTEPVHYAVQLVAQAVTVTLVAVVILLPFGGPRPTPPRRAGAAL